MRAGLIRGSARWRLLLWLAAAALGAGSCSSPSRPSQPVDQFPDGPRISCPAAPSPATSNNGAAVAVQFAAPTTTGGAPPVSVACTPASGSNFSRGSTTVTCTATDARQRTDQCSFAVVVALAPRISITSFVAFGDSITAGEDGSSSVAFGSTAMARPRVLLPVAQRYPSALEGMLKARYTAQNPTVANAGEPGEKAGSLITLTRFRRVLSSGSWGAILILEGSNDIIDRDAREIPATIQGLRTMVQTARGQNVRPYLATIPPMVPGTLRGGASSLVPAVNSGIRNIAASENVTLVDVEAAFGTAYQQYIGGDGLHPNAAGYSKIAETFFNILKTTLETQTQTTSLSNAQPFSRRRR